MTGVERSARRRGLAVDPAAAAQGRAPAGARASACCPGSASRGGRRRAARPGAHPARRRASTPLTWRRYAEVCGFPRKDTLPVTYPHVLAFPLHLAIMTDGVVPVPRHRHRAPGELRSPSTARCWRPSRSRSPSGPAGSASAPEGPGLRPRHHGPRARRARSGRRPRRSCAGAPGRAPATGARPSASASRRPARHRRSGGCRATSAGGTPRSRATTTRSTCTRLTAKAFGFPRQIAHGMWSMARCVAAVENRLPDAVRVDVAFKKPVLLPGTVSFGTARDAGRSGLRAHQPEGRVTPPGRPRRRSSL